MSNTENFVTVTSIDNVETPSTFQDAVFSNFHNEANPVVRSRAAIINEHQDGTHSFQTVDYNAHDKTIKTTVRQIVAAQFKQMDQDFAQLTGGDQ